MDDCSPPLATMGRCGFGIRSSNPGYRSVADSLIATSPSTSGISCYPDFHMSALALPYLPVKALRMMLHLLDTPNSPQAGSLSTATAVIAVPVRGRGSGRRGPGLASSAPPRPVGGVVEVGPWPADEGVEQAPEFGHGQGDELAGSGCGAPFS